MENFLTKFVAIFRPFYFPNFNIFSLSENEKCQNVENLPVKTVEIGNEISSEPSGDQTVEPQILFFEIHESKVFQNALI